jgi:hypothetical protein
MKKEIDIFKEKNSLVGGLVPRPLAELFSLYCLYTHSTRSHVIAELIQSLLSKESETHMIDTIADLIAPKLEGLPISKQRLILSQARTMLEKKKIRPAHILLILKEAKRLCKEQQ